jgi:glutamine synthetase
VPADLAITSFGGIWHENPFGSYGDLRLQPVKGSQYVLPGISGAEELTVHLARQVLPDGTVWVNDPRSFAEAALADLRAEFGIDLVAAFEHEFILHGLASKGSPFGLDAMRIAEPFGSELFQLLIENGMNPENWLPEYGSGQFEVTLKAADALTAADHAIILREMVRDIAHRNNLRASFVPLPHPDSVGNGVHIHLSLWRKGKPITFDASRPGNLSREAATAFNGILEHASAILAFTAPSQISFLRLQPDRWSSGGAFIAVQDREALLRICPVNTIAKAAPESSFNVEFRAADATANPWIVIGTLARALLSGLREGAEISEIGANNKSLPRSLSDAIDSLRCNEEVKSWYPPELLDTHLGIREEEASALERLSDVEKCERYGDVY